MSRRWKVFGPLMGVLLLMLTGGTRTETRGTPRLFDVVTAHRVIDGVPLEPTDVFTPEDTPIYVSFRCDGCAIGMVITSSWWDPGAGAPAALRQRDGDGGDTRGFRRVSLRPGAGKTLVGRCLSGRAAGGRRACGAGAVPRRRHNAPRRTCAGWPAPRALGTTTKS